MMHAIEQKILQRMASEPGREISTTELVKGVFHDEYEEVKRLLYNEQRDGEMMRLGRRKKARLHRKILYHLGLLVSGNALAVTRTEGKGEKYFALSPENGANHKAASVVESVVPARKEMNMLSGLESYEEEKIIGRFDPQGWLSKINALVIEPNANAKALYERISELYPVYNDVLGVLDFESIINSEDLESLNSFIKRVDVDTRDYNKQVNLIIDLAKARDSVKLSDFVTSFSEIAPKNVFIMLQAGQKSLVGHIRFFRQLIKCFSEKKIRINLQNTDIHTAPYMIGRAGVYTFNEHDWHDYAKNIKGKTIGLCCCETSIYVDVNRFFKQKRSYTEFRDMLLRAARTLLSASSAQRRKSDVYFRSLNERNQDESAFFSKSRNYIRLWNYDSSDDATHENFRNLLATCSDEINKFCLSEQTIFKSCGIPIRFSVALSSAFSHFDRDALSPRMYSKLTIRNSSDMNSASNMTYMRRRESLYDVFSGGDRVRFFRTPNFVADDIIAEFTMLMGNYSMQLISYDFKPRKGEMTLDTFFDT